MRRGLAAVIAAAVIVSGLLTPSTARAAVSGEYPVSSTAYGSDPGAQVGSAVAWSSRISKYLTLWLDGGVIRGELVGTDGVPASPTYSFTITPTASPSDLVVGGAGGMYLAAWSQGGDIWGQRFLDDQPLGSPFAVSTAEDRQFNPVVAKAGTATTGNFLVAWEDQRDNYLFGTNTNYAASEIWGARVSAAIFPSDLVLDDDGLEIGPAGRLRSPFGEEYERYISDEQREPAIGFDGTNFLVAWSGETETGATGSYENFHVKGRFVSTTGAAAAPAFNITTATDGTNEYEPDLIWNAASTRYFAAWRTGSTGDIRGSRITTAGALSDPSFLAIATGAAHQARPRVSSIGSGYYVAWEEPGNGSDVIGAWVRQDPTGIRGWLISRQPLVTEVGDQRQAVLASSGTTLLAAWGDGRVSTNFDVYAGRIASNGASVDGQGSLLSRAATIQEDPILAFNGTDYLVAWTDRGSPGASNSKHRLLAGRMTPTGTRRDGGGILVTDQADNGPRPGIASNGEDFLIAWSSGFKIYASRVSAAGVLLDATPLPIFTPAYQGTNPTPEVAWNGENYVIAFSFFESAASGIKFVRVASDGTVLDATPQTVASGTNGGALPDIACGDRACLIAYMAYRAGDGWDIAGRRIALDGRLLGTGPIPISLGTKEQGFPSVAWDGANYLVAWQDERVAPVNKSDVYGARVSAAGIVLDPDGFPIANAPVGQGGQQPDVGSNGVSFLVGYRTFGGALQAVEVSDAGIVGSPIAIASPAVTGPTLTSWPGQVGIAYDRQATEPTYGDVRRVFLKVKSDLVIHVGDTTVSEGDSGPVSAVFTVSITGSSASAIPFSWETVALGATSPSDFEAQSGSGTVPAGNRTSTTVEIAVNGDTLDEFDERFGLRITSATGALAANVPGQATIVDDDAAPTVAISDATVTEVDSGTIVMSFTASLSAVSGKPVSVAFATADATALAAKDYVAKSGTVSFAAGQTTRPVTVAIKGDLLDEPTETFRVLLSAPVNTSISDGTGIGRIVDDDPLPALAVSDVTMVEGDSAATNAVFSITLSQKSGKTVTVDFATANGTATAGSDYRARTGSLTFLPGQIRKTVAVGVLGDLAVEPNETFLLNIAGQVNATRADGQGRAQITNDD